MTHDELLAKIKRQDNFIPRHPMRDALRAVVELHKPHTFIDGETMCDLECKDSNWNISSYPCPTIQAIQEELNK